MNTLDDIKQAAVISTLRKSCIFSGLPPADLEKVAAFVVVKRLEKGACLFLEGEPSRGFYIVQKGAINVHRVSPQGREQVIHVFRAGESFGEGVLATESGYPADARAVEPSQVLLVRKAGFLELLKRQPELALRMLASLSVHLRTLVSQIDDLTSKDVETRLVHWLLKRCPAENGSHPVEIDLGISKRVLAAELGTVSETLSRALARFRDKNLLEVRGRKLVVLSPNQLRNHRQ